MNIAICDDEKAIREQIKELIEKLGICPELYETGDALLAAWKQFDMMERSREAAEERRQQMEIAYKKQSIAKALANHTMDTSRYTYTTTSGTMDSAITAYAKNIMEAAGILK